MNFEMWEKENIEFRNKSTLKIQTPGMTLFFNKISFYEWILIWFKYMKYSKSSINEGK